MGFRLGPEEIRYISLFESITGATVKDCLFDDHDESVVYVVKEGEVGLAIGKKGANLGRVREMINKGVDIVEYSEDPRKFIENIMRPAKITNVTITERTDKKRVAMVEVPKKDRGIAIGRSGKTINRAKVLLKRHHGVDDVSIM
ncbi:MAG: NusA-like transcription termination signal-binding factor [Candidatus Methanofastidiosa archaeon]|jgi:N utilization substance protein A|nr:NusA-like transcription termination signal-binding factor [Candidatus Methanofastidiosa archaeon]MDD4281305.1 NusA-like transcription termination signal-binding factor [Candidatus Methanofastidiosa archaeon]